MDDDTPIYEALFSMQVSLCKLFPSLTPFDLRREKAREVFKLIVRYKTYTENEQKQNKTNNNKRVTRRPAGDDWF